MTLACGCRGGQNPERDAQPAGGDRGPMVSDAGTADGPAHAPEAAVSGDDGPREVSVPSWDAGDAPAFDLGPTSDQSAGAERTNEGGSDVAAAPGVDAAAADLHPDTAADLASAATMVVRGRVRDENAPLAGAAVIIGGSSTATAGDGSFTITGVTPPYDVVVVLDKSIAQVNEAYVFVGLNRSDPTLEVPEADTVPASATISGTLSGPGGFPLPADGAAQVIADAPDTWAFWPVAPGPGYGPVEVGWFGGTTRTTGTLHALQWLTDGAGVPVEYKGYGSVPFSVVDQGMVSGQDIALGALGSGQIAGNVTMPSGYSMFRKRVFAYVGASRRASATFEIVRDDSAPPSFDYKTPTIKGATIGVMAIAVQGDRKAAAYRSGSATTATGVDLVLRSAPAPVLPVDGAVKVDHGTEFLWNPMSSAVHQLIIQSSTPGTPVFVIVTTGNRARIPDLDRAGLALPRGTSYQWEIFALGPYATMDEATQPTGFAFHFSGQHAPAKDGFGGFSEKRRFTTAP
jgi:hypothetical protein